MIYNKPKNNSVFKTVIKSFFGGTLLYIIVFMYGGISGYINGIDISVLEWVICIVIFPILVSIKNKCMWFLTIRQRDYRRALETIKEHNCNEVIIGYCDEELWNNTVLRCKTIDYNMHEVFSSRPIFICNRRIKKYLEEETLKSIIKAYPERFSKEIIDGDCIMSDGLLKIRVKRKQEESERRLREEKKKSELQHQREFSNNIPM